MKMGLSSGLAMPPLTYGVVPHKVGRGKKSVAVMALIAAGAMMITLMAMAVADSLSTRAVTLLSARQFYKLAQAEAAEQLQKEAIDSQDVGIHQVRLSEGVDYGTAFPPKSFTGHPMQLKNAARLCGIYACSESGCRNDAFFSCMSLRSNGERYVLLGNQYPIDLTESSGDAEAEVDEPLVLAKASGSETEKKKHRKHKHKRHRLTSDNLLVGELGILPDEKNIKLGELANLPKDKNLIEGELANIPAELNLIEGELGNLPKEKNLLVGELGELPAEKNLMEGELANLPSEKNLIIGELGDLPPEKNLIVGELGDLPSEKNLIVGELGDLPAEKNLIVGELGDLPAEKNLIVGELGDLPAEKNLIQGELGTLPVSTISKDCGAGACDPKTGCNDSAFFSCMMYQVGGSDASRSPRRARSPGLGFNY